MNNNKPVWKPPISIIVWMVAIVVLLLAADARCFDLPDMDPWYYYDHSRVSFWVPDKAQHFWGSQLLATELPWLYAFGLGLAYELHQERQGVGFSCRDLVANGLGVAAAKLNNRRFKLWLDYSTYESTITLNATLRF
jgi:hypothetical protein